MTDLNKTAALRTALRRIDPESPDVMQQLATALGDYASTPADIKNLWRAGAERLLRAAPTETGAAHTPARGGQWWPSGAAPDHGSAPGYWLALPSGGHLSVRFCGNAWEGVYGPVRGYWLAIEPNGMYLEDPGGGARRFATAAEAQAAVLEWWAEPATQAQYA
jgi:hypothetical protein